MSMRILKYIQGFGQDLDFFIATSGHSFVLEWSAPTREQSGRSSHQSIEAAIAEASKLFRIAPERWIDGDPFKCPSLRAGMRVALDSEAILLPDVWEFFSWSARELQQLVATLQLELTYRIEKHEKEKEQYPNDPDERSINREWCDELAAVLRRWCGLLELDPDDLPGYRKALRQSVWNEELIRTDAIPTKVLAILQSRVGTADPVFRPLCLERAHNSLLEWLRRHPEDIDRVHFRTFEAIVAEIIRAAGWSVELTKQTRDGGYDIMCLQNNNAGFPLKVVVETKLYSLDRSVGLPMIDRLMGVRDRERADRAILITNSRITKVAWTLWEDRVMRDLDLVDRDALFDWLREGQAQVEYYNFH
jgi:hypothetical protein